MAEKNKLESMVKATLEEWGRLKTRVNDFEVERAKNVLRTNLMLQLDGSTPVCEDIGRQMLCYGRRIAWPEMLARIDVSGGGRKSFFNASPGYRCRSGEECVRKVYS